MDTNKSYKKDVYLTITLPEIFLNGVSSGLIRNVIYYLMSETMLQKSSMYNVLNKYYKKIIFILSPNLLIDDFYINNDNNDNIHDKYYIIIYGIEQHLTSLTIDTTISNKILIKINNTGLSCQYNSFRKNTTISCCFDYMYNLPTGIPDYKNNNKLNVLLKQYFYIQANNNNKKYGNLYLSHINILYMMTLELNDLFNIDNSNLFIDNKKIDISYIRMMREHILLTIDLLYKDNFMNAADANGINTNDINANFSTYDFEKKDVPVQNKIYDTIKNNNNKKTFYSIHSAIKGPINFKNKWYILLNMFLLNKTSNNISNNYLHSCNLNFFKNKYISPSKINYKFDLQIFGDCVYRAIYLPFYTKQIDELIYTNNDDVDD